MKYYLNKGKESVIFSEEERLDPFLIEKVDKRFLEEDADALILGQGPVLSLGFIDPRNWECSCPNPGAFAVRKEKYERLGSVDESLGSAIAADYLYRVRQSGGKCSLAFDILLPCTREFPIDVTDMWLDGIRLDYKYGSNNLRKTCFHKLKEAFLRYDSSIGNYSRKKIVTALPTLLKDVFRYGLKKGTKQGTFDFYGQFTLRGSARLEVRLPSRYPLVSIVVRTYKKADSLRKTLECIRHLDYPRFEVIVVEDGAPEAEAMIRSEYSDLPIRYHATGENIGRAAAANVGFSLASGEWINLLDDDDYLFPEHITVGISEAETTGSDIVLLQSLALETTTTGRDPYEFEINKKHFMRFPRIDPFTMSGYCMTPDNGVLFKRELLADGTKMREDLGANEDWELWLQFMAKGKWTTVHYATCAFVNPASEEAAKARENNYKRWKGKQFESDKLIYSISPQELSRAFVDLLGDVEALIAEGALEDFVNKGKRVHSYSDGEMDEAFRSFEENVNVGKESDYTALQLNKYYWSVFSHFSHASETQRVAEINSIKAARMHALPVKKTKLIGFWPWFDPKDNFILDVLDKRYLIVDDAEPDYLISSLFGYGFYEYIKYDCVRIFFSGENYAPDFNIVDYAMSYNPMVYPERYLYIPEFFVDIRKIGNRLKERLSYEEALEVIKKKREFCNFIYGDSKCCKERGGIFEVLNSRKRVLSAGSWMNNTENGFRADMLSTKADLQRRCRFTIAVESYPHEGFITEKLTDAFLANTIPIYYGDPNVSKIFNPRAFIDVRKFDSLEDLANEIMRLDESPEEMAEMLSQPVFLDCDYLDRLEQSFSSFLYKIMDQPAEKAIKRPINGQPEVHQNHIKQLQAKLEKEERRSQ